jgi:hypothetical protein
VRFPFPAIAAVFRERRAVHQPHPDVTESDVERIVRRDFPREQFDSVMAALKEYAEDKLPKECPRVQLAVLKLAQGNLESVRLQIATAKRDYRDVLAAAEYPEYIRAGFQVRKLPRKERQRIVNSDWDQYQKWLASLG